MTLHAVNFKSTSMSRLALIAVIIFPYIFIASSCNTKTVMDRNVQDDSNQVTPASGDDENDLSENTKNIESKPTEPVAITKNIEKQPAGIKNNNESDTTVNYKPDEQSVTSSPEVKSSPETTPRPDRKRGEQAVAEQNLHYDKNNESYPVLQKANESLANFPVNRINEVDWVAALKEMLINPRASVKGNELMEIRTDEIIMEETRQMPPVIFSHRIHTQWLACSNCHDSIFKAKTGANDINMDKIFRGKYCGVCHNKVAFTTYICEKCHITQ